MRPRKDLTTRLQRKIRRISNAATQLQRKKISFALRVPTALETISANLQRMQRKIRTLETNKKEERLWLELEDKKRGCAGQDGRHLALITISKTQTPEHQRGRPSSKTEQGSADFALHALHELWIGL